MGTGVDTQPSANANITTDVLIPFSIFSSFTFVFLLLGVPSMQLLQQHDQLRLFNGRKLSVLMSLKEQFIYKKVTRAFQCLNVKFCVKTKRHYFLTENGVGDVCRLIVNKSASYFGLQ